MDYETTQMTEDNADQFLLWFNEAIGTECESNEGDEEGAYYFVCLELSPKEMERVKGVDSFISYTEGRGA